MPDLIVTPGNVSKLPGAQSRLYKASASGNVGDSVYISGDGTVAPTDADSTTTLNGLGIVIAAGTFGSLTFNAGDGVSVVFLGPVTGIAGTAGAKGYVSNNLGKISDAAGTNSQVLGVQESANVFFVRPAA